ncbi:MULTISPECIES: hypothetical protein [Streptomyces]|uniref:Uncharacterized protein n=1 Tax=Streptomyces morookaense TaxID=1970 RepID=A0A7Y7B4G7_STRMO|nr:MULTISPECIES: hypothetical protein [Streptomyces]MCC2274059.1 hypothetical protein [Streptomyces sp. ET3-23]NVK78859.1 hypothetical protein [Streptomyces morookaense]GHF35658.1 hypothetical protein GCM10010359_42890 [Streptomyces morookaense]
MILVLNEGVRLIEMPFGDAIVVDRTRPGVQQVSARLAGLLQQRGAVDRLLPPTLTEEIRRGLADGWMSFEEGS